MPEYYHVTSMTEAGTAPWKPLDAPTANGAKREAVEGRPDPKRRKGETLIVGMTFADGSIRPLFWRRRPEEGGASRWFPFGRFSEPEP